MSVMKFLNEASEMVFHGKTHEQAPSDSSSNYNLFDGTDLDNLDLQSILQDIDSFIQQSNSNDVDTVRSSGLERASLGGSPVLNDPSGYIYEQWQTPAVNQVQQFCFLDDLNDLEELLSTHDEQDHTMYDSVSSQNIKVERASPPAPASCHVTENVYCGPYNVHFQDRGLSQSSYFPYPTREYDDMSIMTPQYLGLTELPAFASTKETDSNWMTPTKSNSCQNIDSLTGRRYSDAMTCRFYCCQNTSASSSHPRSQNNSCINNNPPPYPTGQSIQYYNQYQGMSPPMSPQTSSHVVNHQDSLQYIGGHSNSVLPLSVEYQRLQHSSLLFEQHQALMCSSPNLQNPASLAITPPTSPLLSPLQQKSSGMRSNCHSSMEMQNIATDCNATTAFQSETSTTLS